MPRRWEMPTDTPAPPELVAAADGEPLVARILASRGLGSAARATAFLNPDRYAPAAPSALPGLAEAIRLLQDSAERGEAVYVWGDLDADGITSTAVLAEALTLAGLRTACGLPTRAEGHGMPPRAVESALAAGAGTILTCDTGIGENAAIALARDRGLRVIVTDHHDLPIPDLLPDANVLVNPKTLPAGHPLRELSGVGVAWMVARGLADALPHVTRGLDGLLDLVAVGLVADLTMLTGDARYLVQRGIQALRYTSRPGLQRIMALAAVDAAHADEDTISYLIGPRLNAVGRLASAEDGLRLVTTRDTDEAARLAGQLELLNRERKARTEAALAAAEALLRAEPDRQRQPAILVEGRGWDGGVLGQVASTLARRYDRPAVVMSMNEDGLWAGSARSVEGVDVHGAILSGRHLLVREGGHPMAAGFALPRENLPEFRGLLLRHLAKDVAQRPGVPTLAIDALRAPQEIDLTLGAALGRLSPFGPGNPQPVVAVQGLTVARVETGQGGESARYRRLFLSGADGATLRLASFGDVGLPSAGDGVDVAVSVRLGYWRGRERLDVSLIDWRPAERPTHAALVVQGGQQVLDWRSDSRGRDVLLEELEGRYPGRVVVWAEGLDAPPGALRRSELARRGDVALAIAEAPPSAEVLREVLALVRPHVACLLPSAAPQAVDAPGFVRQVAGMLQVALRERDGVLDLQRMASRVGGRTVAVLAALRALEADGRIRLTEDGASNWRAAPGGASVAPDADRRAARRAVEQVIEETAAFRRAYASLPADVLLSAED